MLYYISGGARSGKSRYAMELASSLTDNPVYVATARRWDEDFELRIARHVQDRGDRWTSYEEEKYLATLPLSGRVVVVDCVTLWLTNFFTDYQNDLDRSLESFREEFDRLNLKKSTFILISNELGMGLHADTSLGRKFVDLQGWANQYIAERADKAVFMVSGLPLTLK